MSDPFMDSAPDDHASYEDFYAVDWMPAFAVSVEGARIGLMSCRRCGALVMLSMQEPAAAAVHNEWHRQQGRTDR